MIPNEDGTDDRYRRKIVSRDELKVIIGDRPRPKSVVLCHGTFDLVHPGHLRHLMYARSQADILVVTLTSDAHISKANYRPYVPQDLRAFNLAALEVVDFVLIDDEAELMCADLRDDDEQIGIGNVVGSAELEKLAQ